MFAFNVVVFFSQLFIRVRFYMCLFDCKYKSLNKLGGNRKTRNRKETEKLREKHNKTEIQYIQPSTRPLINIIYFLAEVRGLDILYFCFV